VGVGVGVSVDNVVVGGIKIVVPGGGVIPDDAVVVTSGGLTGSVVVGGGNIVVTSGVVIVSGVVIIGYEDTSFVGVSPVIGDDEAISDDCPRIFRNQFNNTSRKFGVFCDNAFVSELLLLVCEISPWAAVIGKIKAIKIMKSKIFQIWQDGLFPSMIFMMTIL
jgi:hypothetical protein